MVGVDLLLEDLDLGEELFLVILQLLDFLVEVVGLLSLLFQGLPQLLILDIELVHLLRVFWHVGDGPAVVGDLGDGSLQVLGGEVRQLRLGSYIELLLHLDPLVLVGARAWAVLVVASPMERVAFQTL